MENKVYAGGKMDNKLKDKVLSIIKNSHSALSNEEVKSRLEENVSNKLIREIIDILKREGRAVISKKGKVMSIERSSCVMADIISVSRNFSFAKPLDGGEEIFIAKLDLKNAIIGDRVLINKIKKSFKGLSGKVKEIINKGDHTVIGRVVQGINGLELVCDAAVRYNVNIKKESLNGVKTGDKVKALLFRVKGRDSLCAEIIEVFGKSDIAKICADAIMSIRQIPMEFSNQALSLADKASKININDEIKRRLDLRDEIIFTIDGEDSKDLDDAISIKKNGNGWELGVHIADVSHYVKMDTKLDKEAFLRGTSVYYADNVIPMFPKVISNGVCSLNQGTDKLTVSAIINLNARGEIESFRFVESVINSKVRGVYSEINKILNNNADDKILIKYSKILDSLKLAKELSDILSENSKNRGVSDILSGESKFIMDKNGVCIDIKPKIQGESEIIIENLMITANIAAARLAESLNIPFVYRVHESPDSSKVEILSKLAGVLGLKNNKIRPGLSPKDLSNLLDQTKGFSTNKIISRQILQTMAKAKYDPKPIGHFGLALKDYCHFTSPIRRYPDICVHRILKDIINGMPREDIFNKYDDLTQEYAKQSTICEIRAMKAERDAEKYYMAEFMTKHVGEFYEGIIDGASSKGVFVELDNSVSGFLDVSYYPNCKFVFDGLMSHVDIISGRKLTVGDKIKVKVISASVSLGQIDFAPAEIFD